MKNRSEIEPIQLHHHRPPGPAVTPHRVMKAIPETGGRLTDIAKRLKCSTYMLRQKLMKEGTEWDHVRELLKEEQERIGDLAEKVIEDVLKQRLDLNVAERAAFKVLATRRYQQRSFDSPQTVTLEGGKNPVQLVHQMTPVDVTKLSLEARRELLESLEKKEED